MYLIRIALIFIIVFLIIRTFVKAGSIEEPEKKKEGESNTIKKPLKGVPKGIGEYVDYEDVDKPEKLP